MPLVLRSIKTNLQLSTEKITPISKMQLQLINSSTLMTKLVVIIDVDVEISTFYVLAVIKLQKIVHKKVDKLNQF